MANKAEKTWKVVITDKENKHSDFDLITELEGKLNELEDSGYEPRIVQELGRSGGDSFIAILGKRVK